ncbi:hypothetical protein NHQ30_010423 [Ciborinia camelliae]|nr:hypothetical protein NHQ30_010423 [Ciborinia camelliae]
MLPLTDQFLEALGISRAENPWLNNLPFFCTCLIRCATRLPGQKLMKERYPDSRGNEAYINILHDAFIKDPAKMAKIIGPALPQLEQKFPDIAEALCNLCDHPFPEFSTRIVGIIKESLTRTSQPRGHNLAAKQRSEVVLGWADVNRTVIAGDEISTKNMQMVASSAKHVFRQANGIHVFGKSFVDRINYYGRWIHTISATRLPQGYLAIKVLTTISDHLEGSGSGGPKGFARSVYDGIRMKIDGINDAERDNHLFFVYHPETNWYEAFNQLIRQDPFPPTFCAKSDDLNALCRYMQDVREQLQWGSECVNGAGAALGFGVATVIGVPTALVPLAACPIWFGTAMPAMKKAATAISKTIYGALREESPRVLGSSQRLGVETYYWRSSQGW